MTENHELFVIGGRGNFENGEEGSCGISTWPTRFMRRFPSFCFSGVWFARNVSAVALWREHSCEWPNGFAPQFDAVLQSRPGSATSNIFRGISFRSASPDRARAQPQTRDGLISASASTWLAGDQHSSLMRSIR